MSDNPNLGFTRFVPGFDFLQNLAKGAGQSLPQMPNLSNWVAPTLSVEELDKRLQELKAVLFWLEQNARALGATIQALEVQKMTLATLQGMNFSMGDVADALKLHPAGDAAADAPKKAAPARDGKDAQAPQAGQLVDPLQWWGSLTAQFQQIAADAFKDAAAGAQAGSAPHNAAPASRPRKTAARKTPARKARAT